MGEFMSGHSKWKTIKQKKGAADAKKGRIFTKLIKEVTVAVKNGGPDPEANPRLRLAVQNCKGANMPKDNLERAIKKATGADGTEYVEATFEAYGTDGAAFFIECATDNKTRTVANIRSYFTKFNGSLGKDGCLQFIFDRKGIFTLDANGVDEDEFTLSMIDAGAEDVEFDDEMIAVTCPMEDFGNVQKKLIEMEIEPQEAGLQRIPNTFKKLDQEGMEKFMKLLDLIEDDDDVQKVYHNVEYDESLMDNQ